MNAKLVNLMEEEAIRDFETLGTCDAGSQEYADILSDTMKIMSCINDNEQLKYKMQELTSNNSVKEKDIETKKNIEKAKIDFENTKHNDNITIEQQKVILERDRLALDRQKLDLDKINSLRNYDTEQSRQKVDTVVGVIGAVANIATTILNNISYNKWYQMGLKFEETGSFTTDTVKRLLNKKH